LEAQPPAESILPNQSLSDEESEPDTSKKNQEPKGPKFTFKPLDEPVQASTEEKQRDKMEPE